MSEEATPNTNEGAPADGVQKGQESKGQEGQTPKAQETPKINTAAIQREAIEAAKKDLANEVAKIRKDIAAGVTDDIVSRLRPEANKEGEIPELTKALLKQPAEVLKAHEELIVERHRKESAEEKKRLAEENKAFSEISLEFPEVVEDHMDYLEATFLKVQQEDSEMSRTDAIKEASKRVATKLKLTPVSERRKDQNLRRTSIPGGGEWASDSTSFDPDDSVSDYIKGRREAATRFRKKS